MELSTAPIAADVTSKAFIIWFKDLQFRCRKRFDIGRVAGRLVRQDAEVDLAVFALLLQFLQQPVAH